MCKGPTTSAASTTVPSSSASSVSSSSDDSTNTTTLNLNNNDRRNNNKIITRSELKSHNAPSDAWCSVHGTVVNITEFAKVHPGGDIILLAAGKDATTLVETYHPRGYPRSTIQKLMVGHLENGALEESFYSWNESDFYSVMKKRVLQRLTELKLNRRGSTEIWIKAICILVGFWHALYKMYTTENFYIACLWSVSMGVWAHFVGTCIQHDGNHGAFAKSRWMNKTAGWTMDMIGASGFTWEIQHMLGHHPYTNLLDLTESEKKELELDCPMEDKDQESDPDVFSSFPLMRMHPEHQPEWYHKYQHYYAPLLFAFMTIAKVFQQDFEIVLTHRLYHIDAHCRYADFKNRLRFWLMKLITTFYMLILPCWFHGIIKGSTLFVLGHLTCGEVLATVFIVNHVIEGVAYAKKGGSANQDGSVVIRHVTTTNDSEHENNSHIDTNTRRPQTAQGKTPMLDIPKNPQQQHDPVPLNDWAAVQCQTSVNWSPGSWFWNHVSGGLSHQIEHHLFPSVCHTHYVHIQDVVQQTCEEYGVPYQSEPSLYIAYGKMMSHLKTLGSALSTDHHDDNTTTEKKIKQS